MIDKILEFNKKFVENKEYEKYSTSKYPNKKIAILSCMDTRLTELLPAALGLKNGDVKLIKNAGASVSSPFGSVMRSLVVAIYNLNVEEILVIGHHDCGMQNINSTEIIEKMKSRNVQINNINFSLYKDFDINKWLSGFDSVEISIKSTVDFIKNHPLIPSDVNVFGLIIDPSTGKLDRVI